MSIPHPTSDTTVTTQSWGLDLALAMALADMERGIHDLSKTLVGYPHTDLPGTLSLLRQVRASRIELAEVEAIIEAKAAHLMTEDTFEAPSLYARRRGGTSRKAWDNDRLAGRVTHHIATNTALDPATGEVDEDLAHRVTEAAELLWTLARPSWRTGALKKLGIAFDDCCETTYGRRTVQVSTEPSPENESSE